ncbi:hypothetical protein AC578_9709 [Pseudocercospora eumusae]|uniref:Uncharacterized protein n=1 Tax=Pseudocercospora eumusae TaxID=321146 RepID=A0A139HQR5_9PEZI|nr:hypothetical protein AC578_9709 [Pseudocercospora eumusae]
MSNPAPVFGPPCSPEIFYQKWLSKLQDHFGTGDFYSLDPIKSLNFLHKAADLTVAFTVEARALGLKESDFRRDQLSVSKTDFPRHLADDKFTNPFLAVLILEATIDVILKTWRKNQHALANAALFQRTGMDSLGDKIDRADRDGNWLALVHDSRILAQVLADKSVNWVSRQLNESRSRG